MNCPQNVTVNLLDSGGNVDTTRPTPAGVQFHTPDASDLRHNLCPGGFAPALRDVGE
jgi:hypothetical protein